MTSHGRACSKLPSPIHLDKSPESSITVVIRTGTIRSQRTVVQTTFANTFVRGHVPDRGSHPISRTRRPVGYALSENANVPPAQQWRAGSSRKYRRINYRTLATISLSLGPRLTADFGTGGLSFVFSRTGGGRTNYCW